MTRRMLMGALAIAATTALQAKPKGRKRRNDQNEDGEQYGFLPREREEIFGYYGGRSSGLPPGLAKRGGDLPPGLAKQLRRNGTLPPGLQKKLEPLPVDLERRLPPCAPGYGRFHIGAQIVLMNRNTRFIADLLALR